MTSQRYSRDEQLRRRDDSLMRRVIGVQVAVLIAVLTDIGLRLPGVQ